MTLTYSGELYFVFYNKFFWEKNVTHLYHPICIQCIISYKKVMPHVQLQTGVKMPEEKSHMQENPVVYVHHDN